MSLTPGSKVLLRRRGKANSAPWFAAQYTPSRLGDAEQPDDGWRVHDAGGGAVLLESLTVKRGEKHRFLGVRWADPWLATPQVWVCPRKSKAAVKWVAHPDGNGGFLLECVSKPDGPKWLSAHRGGLGVVTDRPTGRSLLHEFVALPLADRDTFAAAEAEGDYSHMVPFGMTRTGRVQGVAKEVTPEKPAWAKGRKPGRLTPKGRAGDDTVALELVAALQPSFDDGGHGADCSLYEDEDDPRQIVWPHNIVSLNTVATPTGTVHQHGEGVKHTPPAGELARCRKLAAEVAAALTNLLPFGGDHPTPFLPFYLVIGKGETPPNALTGEGIRAAFRGTIYPDTPIDLKPLTHPEFADRDAGWPLFAAWAQKQKGVTGLTYVCVGYDSCQEPNLPAVFPRLVLGLTKAGSLVGACGSIVQA